MTAGHLLAAALFSAAILTQRNWQRESLRYYASMGQMDNHMLAVKTWINKKLHLSVRSTAMTFRNFNCRYVVFVEEA